MTNKISINQTNVLKGVAILFLIWHHLFRGTNQFGPYFYGISLPQLIGIAGKVCVSLFLLISGYGIALSYKSNQPISRFYAYRFSKIYSTYWFTITLCLLIGWLFFPTAFNQIMKGSILEQQHATVFERGILSYSGFQYIVHYGGFNHDWWFVTVILVCYLFTPVFLWFCHKNNALFLVSGFILAASGCFEGTEENLNASIFRIPFWFFPYMIGIWLSNKNISKIFQICEKKIFKVFILSCFIPIVFLRGLIGQNPYGFLFDSFFSLYLIIVVLEYHSISIFWKALGMLGIYSFEIWIIHSFITGRYAQHLLYYQIHIPLVMMLVVTLISLGAGILVKKIVRLMHLQERIYQLFELALALRSKILPNNVPINQ